MVMQLDQVVPFGRSFGEYVKMFNLTDHNLQKSILSVADGPASFNAEGTRLGYQIKSMDPIYSLTAPQIKDRFDSVVDHIIEQVQQTLEDCLDLSSIPSGLEAKSRTHDSAFL